MGSAPQITSMVEFAEMLRQARERRHLTVDEAARACMLSDKQVLALEAGGIASFYSLAYARRAARKYAEYLAVEPTPDLGFEDSTSRATVAPALRGQLLLSIASFRRRKLWPSLAVMAVLIPCIAMLLAVRVTDRPPKEPEPASCPAEPSSEDCRVAKQAIGSIVAPGGE